MRQRFHKGVKVFLAVDFESLESVFRYVFRSPEAEARKAGSFFWWRVLRCGGGVCSGDYKSEKPEGGGEFT